MLLTDKANQDLNEYVEGRRLHFYNRGETIALIPQGIWQVCRGVVQLGKTDPDGEEILLGWAKPSGFFGTWLTQIDPYQAKALSNVYLRWFSLQEIEKSPQLSQIVLVEVVQRMQQTEALLAIAGLRRIEDRLQQLLVLLGQEMGETVPGGTRLTVRFTHRHLANAIGTTRVTVTRLLGEFQRKSLIALDSDRHIIFRVANHN